MVDMMTRYDVFCKVVETGSFTLTAEKLGYSQSAVSQMIRALEQELGTTLFSRGKTGVTLTANGRQYLPYVRAICGAESALAKKRQEMLGLENSDIRIGTFTSVSRNLLPRLMQRFKARYPGVHFTLQQGDYTGIAQWIQEGSVDFGFVNPKAVEGLDIRPLYRDRMVAVLPPGHPLADHKQVSLWELAREPFILLDEGDYSVPLTAFAALHLHPAIEYKVVDDYSILAMVRQGLGVSALYRMVLPEYQQDVVTLPIAEELERTVAVAWRDWETLPLAARSFMNFIRDESPELLKTIPGVRQAEDGGYR